MEILSIVDAETGENIQFHVDGEDYDRIPYDDLEDYDLNSSEAEFLN